MAVGNESNGIANTYHMIDTLCISAVWNRRWDKTEIYAPVAEVAQFPLEELALSYFFSTSEKGDGDGNEVAGPQANDRDGDECVESCGRTKVDTGQDCL